MNTDQGPVTVKVTVHLGRNGSVAIGVVEQRWNGSVRVDRRMAAARPALESAPAAPRGVPESLWLAWWALDQRLRAWEDDALWRER